MKNAAYKEQNILNSLHRCSGRATTKFLLEDTSLYPTEVSQLLRKLASRGLVTLKDSGVCTLKSTRDSRSDSIARLLEVVSKSLEILNAKERPPLSAQFDQCFATSETTVRRFLYLFARGDLHGKRVLFLGDDDLLSVPVALSGAAHSVRVLDIDDGLLLFLAEIAERNGLDIETHKFDLRETLPLSLKDHADVVVMDPPYTVAGIYTFLARAAQALQNQLGAVCYLSYSPMDLELEEILDVQRIISRTGFIISDSVTDFNRYHPRHDMVSDASRILSDPKSPWFRSSWLRIVAARVPLKVGKKIKEDIYKYEESE